MGTAASQLVLVAASPLISRLYDPSLFGIFAAFIAFASPIGILVTGCLEHAILVPDDDDEARRIIRVALVLSSLVSGCVLAALLFLAEPISDLFSEPRLARALWLVALMAFFTGILQTLNYWFNRQERYRLLARNRMLRAVASVGGMLAFGAVGLTSGLIVGTVVGQAAGAMNLLRHWIAEDEHRRGRAPLTELRRLLIRYRRFPLFSIPGNLINSLSQQLPIVLLGMFFGPLVVGSYSFTQRVLAVPEATFATAIGDVFRQRAAADLNRTSSCRRLWRRTFVALIAISALPLLLVALFGPFAFQLAFGPEWRTAGEYARLLVPFYLFSFTASTLGRITLIAEKQLQDFIWQASLFVVLLVALLLGGRSYSSHTTVLSFSIAYSAMYVVYLVMSYRYCERASPDAGAELGASVP